MKLFTVPPWQVREFYVYQNIAIGILDGRLTQLSIYDGVQKNSQLGIYIRGRPESTICPSIR